mgnify:CR=1 FL=1
MPRRSITNFNRVRIVSLCQKGLSSRQVVRCLGLNQSDVVRSWNHFQNTGNVDDMPRSGRPPATTECDDRYLWFLVMRNPENTAGMINNDFQTATGRRVCNQTVRNRLYDSRLHSRRPWQGPTLTPRHHGQRYTWARNHHQWTEENWHNVLFTDECIVCLVPDNHRQREWR